MGFNLCGYSAPLPVFIFSYYFFYAGLLACLLMLWRPLTIAFVRSSWSIGFNSVD